MKAALLVSAAAAAVVVIVVARRDARPTDLPVLTGMIEARELVVSSELAGRLVAAPVEEGQRVEAGDFLFALDDALLRLDLAALEARQATALAETAALEAGPQRPSVRSQRSRVKEAAVGVAQAQGELARARALRARNAAPAADLEAAELDLRSLTQRLETERQQLALLEAGAPRPSITVAERRAAELVPELARARLRLERARVTAPAGGVVTRRNFEAGELVPAGAAVYALLDTAHLWVELTVNARGHAALEPGARVLVHAEGTHLPPVPARITFIGDRHAFTPRSVETADDRALLTYRVKAELEGAPPAWKPGMFVTVTTGAP